MKHDKRIVISAFVVAATIGALVVVLWLTVFPGARDDAASGHVPIGGAFELVDSKGATVRDTDFLGSYFLVYFGYTFCPDICPTSLNTIAESFDRLPPEQLKHVVALFISVDPERDAGATLDEYTENFHPRIRGLTGSRAQIDAVVAKYRGFYRISKGEDPDYYPVDHSSLIYLMDDKGHYVSHFTHQTSVDKMTAKLKEVLPD